MSHSHHNDPAFSQSRRQLLLGLGGISLLGLLNPSTLYALPHARQFKKIPSSGEKIPVIGMGSSRTFDVGNNAKKRAVLLKVLETFFEKGGGMIDSSPMYGSSEQVIGDLLKKIPEQNKKTLFAATKVWTEGKQAGIEQMQLSMRRMGVKVFDLMQIHNLVDWKTHLATLKEWKAQKKVRYIGITTSHGRFHQQLIEILKTEPFDFVQLSYNIDNLEVERHLLPIAQEKGIAVIVNRPFQRGELFQKTKGKKLPAWASEFDCRSWGQYFLKFAVSHPAVTCAIPATRKMRHMIDNMAAGAGRLPDAKMRTKMRQYYQSL